MQESRRQLWLVAVVCGMACLARIAIFSLQGHQLNVDRDAYLEIAGHLAAGEGFSKDLPPHPTAYRPPLLPLLIAAILKLGGSPYVLGLVHIALGTLCTALTFRIGQLLQLGWASVVAAALVAIDPLLLQNTVLPMTETLCATLVVLWCWVVLEFQTVDTIQISSRTWRPLLHGASFGLICLCRPAFLGAAMLAAAWICLQTIRLWQTETERPKWRQMTHAAIWSSIGLAMMIAPWTIRNAIVMSKMTPATTHGGYTLLLANNPAFYHEVIIQPWGTTWQEASLRRWQEQLEVELEKEGIGRDQEVARDRWMYRQAYSNIRGEPVLFVRACLWRAVRFWDVAPRQTSGGYSRIAIWGSSVFYGSVLIGIFVGLIRLHPIEWKKWRILLLLPLTLWVTHWFYWTDMRMRAPVVPILALLAARACIKEPGGNILMPFTEGIRN
jgi:hypothetical protein